MSAANLGNGGNPIQVLPAPESIQVDQCLVGAVELPNGGMALLFTIPGIRRYAFPLDADARKVVAQLCLGQGLHIASPGEMPH